VNPNVIAQDGPQVTCAPQLFVAVPQVAVP